MRLCGKMVWVESLSLEWRWDEACELPLIPVTQVPIWGMLPWLCSPHPDTSILPLLIHTQKSPEHNSSFEWRGSQVLWRERHSHCSSELSKDWESFLWYSLLRKSFIVKAAFGITEPPIPCPGPRPLGLELVRTTQRGRWYPAGQVVNETGFLGHNIEWEIHYHRGHYWLAHLSLTNSHPRHRLPGHWDMEPEGQVTQFRPKDIEDSHRLFFKTNLPHEWTFSSPMVLPPQID